MEGMTGIGGAGGLRSGESTIQSFEAGPKRPEIRIGRSVVQQVWTDDIGGKLLEVSIISTSPSSIPIY